jgi:hypothetical protein
MRRQTGVALAMFALACASEPTAPEPSDPAAAVAAAGSGSWAKRAAYPVNVLDATGASITDHATSRTTMYVIGGMPKCCGAGLISDAVKAYDATADAWTARAPYPVRVRATNGATEIDGKIYVTGGFTRRWDEQRQVWRLSTLRSLYVYTPSTNTWARKRDMPEATVNGTSVGYRGMLYVATDCYDQSLGCPDVGGGAVWRYNPATDQWRLFGVRPEREWWDVSGGVIGGKLYLVEEFTGNLDILDLATGTWSSGPRRPYRACNAAATAFQATLYLFGYCDDYPTDPEIRDRGLVFDPATGVWSEVAAPPSVAGADAALARVFVNGKPRLSLVQGARPDNHYQYTP